MRVKVAFHLSIFSRSGTPLVKTMDFMSTVFPFVMFALLSNALLIAANEDAESDVPNIIAKRAIIYGNIAFSAFLSSRTDNLPNQKIVFDTAMLNDGDGYDVTTGIFTVPVRGTYFFAFQFEDWASNDNQYASLKINGAIRSSAVIKPMGQSSQAGNTVILHLEKDDQVYVEVDTGNVNGSPTERFTTFSGFILQ